MCLKSSVSDVLMIRVEWCCRHIVCLCVHTELKLRLLFKNAISGKGQEKSFPSSQQDQKAFSEMFFKYSSHCRKKKIMSLGKFCD